MNTMQADWKRSLAVLGALVAVAFRLGAAEAQKDSATTTQPVAVSESPSTTATHPLAPGPNDGTIACVAAMMLERNHYSHHALDDEYSEKFFDRYLEALDPQHLHFIQSDLAEFEHYRDKLDDLTLGNKRSAAAPAFEIFNRFRQRLEQRVAYASELLKAGRFEFEADEFMQTSRKDAPYPKDLAEAKELWRQRVRHEYLLEKLGKQAATKKSEETAPLATTDGDPGKPLPKEAAPKMKSDAEEITDTLTRRYARNLKLFKEWDHEDVLQVYLTALAHVYDPHSDYFNQAQASNFAIGMNNILFGIGAVLTTDLDGYCKIQELKPGPATNSKRVKAGDRIVAVAQGDGPAVDAVEMALNKVVQMIRGPKGTEVRLTIQPANADAADRYVVSLIRDEIKIEEGAAKAKIIEIPNGTPAPLRLGVIDLPTFYAPIDFGMGQPLLAAADGPGYGRYTSKDVANLLIKFEKENVAGVILDLRRNGGGSLEEAVKLTGLFINKGPVVQVLQRHRSEHRLFVDEDNVPGVAYDGPLIVMTSRFSASASEILAGALQDYGRALIVGDQATHGKGTVQQVHGLRRFVDSAATTNDPGQLKVTMSKFYRASGASTQLKGVMPDIVLPSVLSYAQDIGEAALENPLEWDTIEPAKFEKLDLVGPFLGELLKRFSERVATNLDYVYIREDIEQFRKNQADKTISLNEAKRLKEKEEAEARQKARDKERLARKESDRKIYELALKQLELPGLPPPVQKTNHIAGNTSRRGVGAALSTNLVAASANTAVKIPDPTNKLDEEDEAEKPPAVDAALEETERILMDYISLLPRKNLFSAKE